MVISSALRRAPVRVLSGGMLMALGAALSGCAEMSDGMTSAFADPSKYALYDCKQLETERSRLRTRQAELQGLMSKAQTGVAGPVVAEVAYSNEYVAVRGQLKNADEAWVANKCRETPIKTMATPPPAAAPPATSTRGQMKSGSAVY